MIYKKKTEILNRWAEHFQLLLNHQNPYDKELLDDLPNVPVIYSLNRPPQMHELISTIKSLKDNKSYGPDEIPGKILKQGGYHLNLCLLEFIQTLWEDQIHKSWTDATVIPIYKNKGNRNDCNNSRNIFLLSVADKVLARIMLSCLVNHLS
ncbi:uncharacterized protein LOC143020763 [Oratosquilla oratoria]|uniref:uncharacterized protein LOC143020763 n=1 Tax=Oratosquilla oratoria TaxID=337810 RepID=UPI003F7734B5